MRCSECGGLWGPTDMAQHDGVTGDQIRQEGRKQITENM